MVKFFSALKDPKSNPEQEEKLKMLLQGGKGEIKRQHAVDDKLYGTEEGVRIKNESQLANNSSNSNSDGDSDKEGEKKKKKKKIVKRKKSQVGNDNHDKHENNNPPSEGEQESKMMMNKLISMPSIQQAAMGTVAVGTLAILASLIGGGKRGQ